MKGYLKRRRKLPYFPVDSDMRIFGMVYAVVRKHFPGLSDADFDDAISIGFLKVMEVLHKDQYDYRLAKIETYLWACIQRELRWQLVKKKRPVYNDNETLDLNPENEQSNRHTIFSEWEEFKKVLWVHLTTKQRRIFDLRCKGYSLLEIAKITETSISNINAHLKKIKSIGAKLYKQGLQHA